MGLLDFVNSPAGIGLLSAMAGGMAGARRGTPINNIGRGLVTGVQGYQGAKDQIRQDEENALTKQYKSLQMQELESKIANYKAQQEWKSGLPQVMDQAKDKVTPFEADNPFGEDLGNLANVQQGNPQAMQDYMMRPESPYADDLIKQKFVQKTPIKLGKGDRLVDPETYKPLTDMPPMQDDQPDKVRQYRFAVENDGFQGSYVDFLKIVPEAQAEIMYPWRALEARDRDRARVIDERQADYELPRSTGPTRKQSGFAVTAPDGKTYNFPNKQKAEAFRRAAGGQ